MNAIVKIEWTSVDQLREAEYNPRHGNVETIKESLTAHGQYRPIVARLDTGEVLAGNHTLRAARELEWDAVEVAFVDVDDEQAKKILLADNRTADLAVNDDEILSALLSGLPTLEGTGYNEADLEQLKRITGELESLGALDEELGAEHRGAPTRRPKFHFMINFSVREDERAEVMEKLATIASERELANPTEALVSLCVEYNEEHGLSVEVPELKDAG